MALNNESLKKYIKLTKLNVVAIEEDGTEETRVLKLTLNESKTATGSNVIDGAPMIHTDSVVFIAGDEDIEKFLETAEDNGNGITYEGSMKLDVSKPKGKMDGGRWIQTKPARLWLTSTAFSKRGYELIRENRSNETNALKDFFMNVAAVAQNAAAANPTNAAGTNPTNAGPTKRLEPVVVGAK